MSNNKKNKEKNKPRHKRHKANKEEKKKAENNEINLSEKINIKNEKGEIMSNTENNEVNNITDKNLKVKWYNRESFISKKDKNNTIDEENNKQKEEEQVKDSIINEVCVDENINADRLSELKELNVEMLGKLVKNINESNKNREISIEKIIAKVNNARDKITENNDKNYSDLEQISNNIIIEFKEKLSKSNEVVQRAVISEIGKASSRNDSLNDKVTEELKKCVKLTNNVRVNTDEIKINCENTNKSVEKIKKDVQELNMGKVTFVVENISQSVNDMANNIEVIQGKLKSIDEIKVIGDKLDNLISKDKEQKEVDFVNYEDEVLVNIAEYGHKIINELTSAARSFAKNKALIDNATKEKKDHVEEIQRCKECYREEGIKLGRKQLIGELASKFSNLDDLFSSEASASQIITTMLKNNDFDMDKELLKGNEVEITEKNRAEMEVKARFEGIGKYIVGKSAFVFNGNIEIKAELELIQEEII